MGPVVTVLAIALVLMLLERLAPAVRLPLARGWWARVALLNAVQAGAIVVVGRWFEALPWAPRLLDLRHLSPWAGGLVAYLVAVPVYYAWHRARHEVPWLWRLFHQLHHGPRRIEVATSFVKHPLEALGNGLISLSITQVVLGLSGEAGGVYVVLAGAAELFYHSNIRTPRWLGWFVQRPEMHRVHHARGTHAWNYADLPVVDLLFGTYQNPRGDVHAAGFSDADDGPLVELLLARDLRAATCGPVPEVKDAANRRRAPMGVVLVGAIGLAAIAGDTLGIPLLAGAGRATAASPAPKVFTDVRGFETFSAELTLEVRVATGDVRRVTLDPVTARELRGPYNRRNVYGAALAYAPRLPRPLVDDLMRRALLTPGLVAEEVGLPRGGEAAAVEVVSRTDGREQRFRYEVRRDGAFVPAVEVDLARGVGRLGASAQDPPVALLPGGR